MKFSPENRLYIILIALGLFLVIVTIVLQAAVLTSRTGQAGSNDGILATLRRQLANAIEPGQSPSTLGQTSVADTSQAPTATSTPFVIVVPAVPVAAATATAIPPAVTDTPIPIPVVPVPTDTVAPAPLPTDTVAPPAVVEPTNTVPVDTPTALPTQPPAPQPDIRLAYASRRVDCTAITQIVQELLSTRLQMYVQATFFDSSTQMFDALAGDGSDITLCYLDPDDRTLMRERLGLIRQIGVQHNVGEDYKLQIWANGSYKANLRDNRACVLDFLEKVDFTGLDTGSQDPSAWIQSHTDDISRWLNCSL